jgi:phosphoglycolate phosphatase
MPPRFAAAMFDADGTLADTLEDIAAAGNHALAQLGRPPLPVPRYRHLAGQGAHYLVSTALGPDCQHLVGQGLALFRAYQLEHGLDHTRPFPGIPELLDEFTRRGLRLAILSNKGDAATRLLAARVFPRWRFDAVAGLVDGQPFKPDPAGALKIARQLSIPPERWLYFGDTDVDMFTATRAGMFAVGVRWGFREEKELRESGAKLIISHPLEVLTLLDG